MENTFAVTNETNNRRVRWVYDEDYSPVGSFALNTERETKEAEAKEQALIDNGQCVALGAILERKCESCGHWHEVDSCWGIVIEPDANILEEQAHGFLDLD